MSNYELVKNNGMAIKHIIDQTQELALLAVKDDGYALKYVKDEFRTAEVCLIAVQNDGIALQFVPRALQTSEICLAAVTRDGLALEYVYDKTPAIVSMAIKMDPQAAQFISTAERDQ
jgi:hypothetical protein